MKLSLESKCIHLEKEDSQEIYGALSFPIFQTATFAHLGVGKSSGYDYSRLQNPTREQLEKIVCSLENGKDALAFSSGMAAITALMELFHPGDHIIIDEDLYGGSVRLFKTISEKNGLLFSCLNISKENIEGYINEHTKAVFIETPTNPMMNIIDIQKLSAITQERDILLIVDNTFLSPYYQNPLDLGADIVVHSGTKFLCGHNDTIAGFLISHRDDLCEKLRSILVTTGANLAPFDSWLILRGIKTLALRMEQSSENALKIALWLEKNKHVKRVLYPGLKTHQGYDIMCKQSRGFGSMITFEVDSQAFALSILNHIRLIRFAESLGGTESLMTYPITQTHADVPKDELDKRGVTDRILRLSVGIENVDDLIEELKSVFQMAEVEMKD